MSEHTWVFNPSRDRSCASDSSRSGSIVTPWTLPEAIRTEKPSLSFGCFAGTRASGAKPNRVVLVFRRGASTAMILLLLLLPDCSPPPLLTSRTSLSLFPSPLYPSDELKTALHAPPSRSRSPVVSTCGPQKPVKSVFSSASNILCRETTLHPLW